MSKSEEKLMPRPRKTTIETPGEEGTKTSTSAEQNLVSAISAIPDPVDNHLLEEIAEEAQKGNVELPANSNHPKIGAEWAGMVLTEHGWASKPTSENQE